MHPSLSASYLLPAILLNPVLFLHSLNAILSRLLPPIAVASTTQPLPYSRFGPSASHPHLDIHASETLCWSYTILIMIVNMIAFGRISDVREKRREGRRTKEKCVLSVRHDLSPEVKQTNGHAKHLNGLPLSSDGRGGDANNDTALKNYDLECPFTESDVDFDSPGSNITTDSEIIL